MAIEQGKNPNNPQPFNGFGETLTQQNQIFDVPLQTLMYGVVNGQSVKMALVDALASVLGIAASAVVFYPSRDAAVGAVASLPNNVQAMLVTEGTSLVLRWKSWPLNDPLIADAWGVSFTAPNLAGGEAGSVLTKETSADYDFGWSTPQQIVDAATILAVDVQMPDGESVSSAYVSKIDQRTTRNDIVGEGWLPGQMVSVGELTWQATGYTGIPDLPNLAPVGGAFPDHWRWNEVPGTTDMSEAMERCFGFGPAHFMGGDYLISREVGAYGRAGFATLGTGLQNNRSASNKHRTRILLAGGGTYNGINVYTRETVVQEGVTIPTAVNGVEMQNVVFEVKGADMAGGYFLHFEDRPIGVRMSDLEFLDGFQAIRFLGGGFVRMSDCNIFSRNRTTDGGDAVVFEADRRRSDGKPLKPTDVHITGCQFKEFTTGRYRSLTRIRDADGIYLMDNHWQNAREDLVRIDPNSNASADDALASVKFLGNYFDSSNRYHMFFAGTQSKYRDCDVLGNQFRAAAGLGSLVVSPTGPLTDLRISQNKFRDNAQNGVLVTAATASRVRIVDNDFKDNNTANAANVADIRILAGGGNRVSDNNHSGGGANGRAIQVVDAGNMVTDNDMRASTAMNGGTDPNAKIASNAGNINTGNLV